MPEGAPERRKPAKLGPRASKADTKSPQVAGKDDTKSPPKDGTAGKKAKLSPGKDENKKLKTAENATKDESRQLRQVESASKDKKEVPKEDDSISRDEKQPPKEADPVSKDVKQQPKKYDAGGKDEQQQPEMAESASRGEEPQLKKAGSADKQDGEDLTTVLDTDQRAELTLLIANATASMRKLLTDNFDASAGLNKSLLPRGDMTEDEKLMSADPSSFDVEKLDRERKLKEEYEKNLATLKMKNLKKNSLKAFDEWRESVILRVGRVVNSETVAREQIDKQARAGESQPRAPNNIGKIGGSPDKISKLRFRDLFPPTKTSLTKLTMEKRTFILHSILLLLLSLEHYTAPSRILLLNLTSSLKLPLSKFEQDEYTTAKGLLEAAKEIDCCRETKKKAEENKDSRKRKVMLASIAGAAIVGLTGGMAAPMIAAGVGSIMGGLGLGTTAAAGYLGSVAGSTYLVGTLFGAYGGKMTGEMMDNYAREVEDFEFLPVHSRNKTSEDQTEGAKQASDHDHKLRVTICISGWLTNKEEVVKPWRVLGTAAEVFALKYELESLLNLGNAMNGMVQSAAWGYAQKELIAQTMFADLAAAMWPIGLIKVSRVIDNPFSVAKGRAEKAGEVLADALINKAQGERPVTLIGYSLGARVIYTCLMSLAKRKAFGLIESVVLIGAPTPSDTADWRIIRSVVSGRLINVFSTNDYLLGFLYRTSSLQYGIAGLQKVEGLAGVENLDVSEDVNGHLKYRFLVGSILKKLGFEDVNMEAVVEEHQALIKMEKEEEKQSFESQRKRLLRRQSTQGKEDENAEAEHEATELEKAIQASTHMSLVSQAIQWYYTPNVPSAKDAEKVAGNVQDVTKDPTKAGDAAGKTVEDVQSSTRTYSQWAAEKLPSMPGLRGKPTGASVRKAATDPAKAKGENGKTGSPSKAADQAGKTASYAAASTRSYTQYAAEYLPSMPSMPELPSMPNLSSRSREKSSPVDAAKDVVANSTDTTKSAASGTRDAAKNAASSMTDTTKQAASMTQTTAKSAASGTNDAAKVASNPPDAAKGMADSGQSALHGAAGIAGDVVKPTIRNIQEPQNNPAVKAVTDSKKQVPIIHQASDKITEAAGGTPDSKAEKSYMSQASDKIAAATWNKKHEEADKSYVAQASDKIVSATSSTKASKVKAEGQSYAAKASSYLSSMPSMPTFGSSAGKKADPKSKEKPDSEKEENPSMEKNPKPAPPRRTTSDAKKFLPRLDRVPSGMKSPAAPTKLDNTPGVPKLEGLPKGVKSPPPKLGGGQGAAKGTAKQVSDRGEKVLKEGGKTLKNPPAKLDRVPSGLKSAPGAAKGVSQGAAEQASGAAKKVSDGGQKALKEGGNAASKAAGAVTGTLPSIGFGK